MMRTVYFSKSAFSSSILSFGALLFFTLCLSSNSHAATGAKWSSKYLGEGSSSHSASSSSSESSPVSPFSPGSNNLALELGQVFLMGGLTKYNDSIGTQIHYTYGVSDLFGFDSSIGYSQHSNGQLTMVSALTGMRMNLAWYDKVIPYVAGGLGFYCPIYQDWTAPAGNPNTLSALLFGMHIGPGVNLELTKNIFFGASLIFHTTFGSTQNLANGTPLNLGGSFTSFLLQMGATF